MTIWTKIKFQCLENLCANRTDIFHLYILQVIPHIILTAHYSYQKPNLKYKPVQENRQKQKYKKKCNRNYDLVANSSSVNGVTWYKKQRLHTRTGFTWPYRGSGTELELHRAQKTCNHTHHYCSIVKLRICAHEGGKIMYHTGNGAPIFIICIYLHTGKNIYHGSHKFTKGIIILPLFFELTFSDLPPGLAQQMQNSRTNPMTESVW